jgi:hypothetical protein
VGYGAARFFGFMFQDFKRLFVYPSRPRLPEDRIPADKNGKPDLSFYTEPVTYYIDLYNAHLAAYRKGSTAEEQALAFRRRVHGTWGLLAKGQEALPFILTLIRQPDSDAREDGYLLLAELKSDAAAGERLLEYLQSETDLVALSSLIEALGECRYRPAIPALRSLILDFSTDVDTRWNAVDSLGSIVGLDFSGPDKVAKAEAWLASQEQQPDA